MQVKVRGNQLELRESRYPDGQLALVLHSLAGEPWGTVSVSVPGVALGPREFVAKVWSENAGIFEELERQGCVRDTGRRVQCGFAVGYVAEVATPL